MGQDYSKDVEKFEQAFEPLGAILWVIFVIWSFFVIIKLILNFILGGV